MKRTRYESKYDIKKYKTKKYGTKNNKNIHFIIKRQYHLSDSFVILRDINSSIISDFISRILQGMGGD